MTLAWNFTGSILTSSNCLLSGTTSLRSWDTAVLSAVGIPGPLLQFEGSQATFLAPTLPPNSHAIRGASAPKLPTPKMFPACRLNSQPTTLPKLGNKNTASAPRHGLTWALRGAPAGICIPAPYHNHSSDLEERVRYFHNTLGHGTALRRLRKA